MSDLPPPEASKITEPSKTAEPSKITDTIVLVHGLWMTPRSWEHLVPYYEAKGYQVLTPAYPGFEIEVEALRENPEVIANLTVPETVDHLAAVIEALETPPFIVGHSFGGTLTQLLLARGLGSVGVVIDSAPTEGVRVNPLSQARSLFPPSRTPPTFIGRSALLRRSFTTPSPTPSAPRSRGRFGSGTRSQRLATGSGRTG